MNKEIQDFLESLLPKMSKKEQRIALKQVTAWADADSKKQAEVDPLANIGRA